MGPAGKARLGYSRSQRLTTVHPRGDKPDSETVKSAFTRVRVMVAAAELLDALADQRPELNGGFDRVSFVIWMQIEDRRHAQWNLGQEGG